MALVREYVLPPSEGSQQPLHVHVSQAGMACCGMEFAAAVARGLLVPATPDGDRAASAVNVLVVAGTVTHDLAVPLQEALAALPEPRAVLSFGACSNSGGPYWDSYAVVAGIDSFLPVASYVPGCPPRPEALVEALRKLQDMASLAGT